MSLMSMHYKGVSVQLNTYKYVYEKLCDRSSASFGEISKKIQEFCVKYNIDNERAELVQVCTLAHLWYNLGIDVPEMDSGRNLYLVYALERIDEKEIDILAKQLEEETNKRLQAQLEDAKANLDHAQVEYDNIKTVLDNIDKVEYAHSQ